jgi:TRAP-type C4-dicarboxylate transport system substrate-binding protein
MRKNCTKPLTNAWQKWRFFHFFQIVVVSLISIFCFSAESTPITYKFATNALPQYLRGNAEYSFLKEIEKQTNGAVSFVYHFDSTLLQGEEILDAVETGVVEFGHVNIAYYPKRLILNNAILLNQTGPTEFDNKVWVYDKIYHDLPVLKEELLKFNQRIIYIYPVLPTAICFNKPVKSFADFKGKRIRSASRWSLDIMKGIGVVPISAPRDACYIGLKTNAIEGVLTRYGGSYIGVLDEVAKYIFIARELWTPIPYLVTINLDTWNSFSKAIQEKIEQSAVVARNNFKNEYSKWFDWYLNDQKTRGCKITFASKADIELWNSVPEINRIQEQWIAEASAAGVDRADQLLNRMIQIVKEGIQRDQRPSLNDNP